MKLFASLILLFSTCTAHVFAQRNFVNDTLHYQENVHVYDIDFFGVERTLNWDTISQLSPLNQVVLKFHNHTLAPIEVKKLSGKGEVVSWSSPSRKITIPPNGTYDIRVSYEFAIGNFESDFNLKFKHLGERHHVDFKTFGVVQEINKTDENGKKQGKWIELNEEGLVKQLQHYQNGVSIKNLRYHYYANGNVRLKMDFFNHIDTYYYESGEKQIEVTPTSKTVYYLTGVVRSLETEKRYVTYNQEGGQLSFRNQYTSKVLNEYEMLMEESFYPNGFLKKEVFANGKVIHYSEQVEGCLIQVLKKYNGRDLVAFDYENCELASITNNISLDQNKSPYTVKLGTFENEELVDGRIEYYAKKGVLRFAEEVLNKRSTGAIWLNEVKYNVTDKLGRQGIWISNQNGWNDWRRNASDEILLKTSYKNGVQLDTVFHYYLGGNLKAIDVKRKSKDEPTKISYYESGNVSEKQYAFHQAYQMKVYKVEKFEDSVGEVLKSVTSNTYYFTYKNGEIISRKSEAKKVDGSTVIPSRNKYQYTLATGSFRNEHIYNGKITYYNSYDEALRAVRVVNGKIDGDRIIIFEDIAFEMELTSGHSIVDRDGNGYITRSEIETLKKLEIQGRWIESVADLGAFKRLREFYVNGRKVESNLSDEPEVLVELKKLAQMSQLPSKRRRGGWFIDPPEPEPEPLPEIFDFVEKEPNFIGGPEALMEFIKNEMQYPAISLENKEQGTVYISFIVNKDGSIEKPEIRKGVSAALDKEAKRIINNMPKWIPGEQAGREVRVRFTLPIRFVLP